MLTCETLKHRSRDGAVLPVSVWPGVPERKPVILLHSLFFDATMFATCLPALAGDRTIIAPTFRGQRSADLGAHAPTIAQLVDDLVDQLAVLDVGPLHLVGSSMGGYVAMEFIRNHGGRVASLSLSCCTCEREQRPERFEALSQYIASGPHPDTASRLAGIMFGKTSVTAPTPVVREWIDRFADTPPEMSAVIDAMFAHPAYDDVLARYDGPALLMAGAEDAAKSPADMERIASHLRDGRMKTFDRCGHTPAVEVPEAYGSTLAAFLAEVDATEFADERGARNVH